ncbi:alpha-1,2-mannosyltransferase ALG9-like [Dysidea avara]|uniref:alpha-1,2-mannosyltransferase ALG9-like n=1 Tax=Dysidea avara TaxID=196820 RepID=UPI0033288790
MAWNPSFMRAFQLLLVVRLFSGTFSNISDCDETFNYWEPMHYLLYGSGFQTWEYSPVYAIRSYAYLLLHAIPGVVIATKHKYVVFHLVRILLAIISAALETFFYRSVLIKFGSDVACWTLLLLVGSCGMYIAAAAYLPSSFAMYCTMVALGAWFQRKRKIAVSAVIISTLVGWPFSGVIGLPIFLEYFYKRPISLIKWSSICFIIVSVPLVVIDSLFYGKFVFAPLNIVLYNIFSGQGPELYGTEPWTFYFKNMFLNMNIAFLLALLSVIIITVRVIFKVLWNLSLQGVKSDRWFPAVISLLIWLLVFFPQPHKEERFLFPVYPLFCLAGAVAFQLFKDIMVQLSLTIRIIPVIKYFIRPMYKWLPYLLCFVHFCISVSRGSALYSNYRAPLDVYYTLRYPHITSAIKGLEEVNICVGKEWYRFPSSFYLPGNQWHLRFLRSEFRGQLPKQYSESTRVIPTDMNNKNQEETSRYFDISKCHFLVDLDNREITPREPRYILDNSTWTVVHRFSFLDLQRSHSFFRSFYFPYISDVCNAYTDYMLLANKNLIRVRL